MYILPSSLLEEFKKAYPKINVESEINKMNVWLISNPTKRKTEKGMPRFINSWLSRCNELPKPQVKETVPEDWDKPAEVIDVEDTGEFEKFMRLANETTK